MWIQKMSEDKNDGFDYVLNAWGSKHPIKFEVGSYANNDSLAVQMYTVDEDGFVEP